MNTHVFQKEIWTYYKTHGRKLPWRETNNPYNIFVSEMMLQQTQVSRVIKKYSEFIQKFPTFQSLANAQLSDVLLVWQGMGYNRRAKYMKEIAERVVRDYNGILPSDIHTLRSFPGIGSGTAGSLIAFVYNEPVCFVETNIRRVMIHFFFRRKTNIHERDILKKVEETLDTSRPREWYYALMDYGAMLLKKENINVNRKSKIYKKPSSFKGSQRQLRGCIISFLLSKKRATATQIVHECMCTQHNIKKALSSLLRERMIQKNGHYYFISHN